MGRGDFQLVWNCKFQPHTDLCIMTQNTEEEINELIAELDPDENGFLDWIQWVTQLISVSYSLDSIVDP